MTTEAASEGERTEDAIITDTHSRVDDAASPAADVSRAVAVVPKQRIVATSNVAIWDTAALDHMGRVGAIMASSMLASPTIYDGVDAQGAVARMVMIANLSRECGANPLMFLQGCSIISNKLHLEGKVVSAIITSRTGVRLRYRFGVWVKGAISFPDDPQDAAFFKDAGEMLAVRVEDPDDYERFVDGYVGLWKTDRKGSPWSNPANWRRQLRYRGAPEWARAYEPGAVLGFYSDADEDLEEFEAPGPRPKRNLRVKLAEGAASPSGAGAADTGFNRAHVAAETGENRDDDPVHQAVAGEEAEVVECDHEFETIGDDENVCKHCGVLDDEVDGKETPENSEEAEGDDDAVVAEDEADAAFLADLSGEDVGDVLARIKALKAAGETLAENPQAEAGEAYLLAGDAFTGKDKRRVTYKDGARFSSCGPQGAEKLKVYAIHADTPEEEERPTLEEGDTAKDGVQGAETDPATSGSAPAASEASQEPAASSRVPSDDPVVEMVHKKFGAMPDWGAIKTEWALMCRTTDFVGASPQDQDAIRRAAWPLLAKLRVDQAADITAFGIWMPTQTGSDGADAITGTFNVLKNSDVWKKLTPPQMETLEKRVASTVAALVGSKG